MTQNLTLYTKITLLSILRIYYSGLSRFAQTLCKLTLARAVAFDSRLWIEKSFTFGANFLLNLFIIQCPYFSVVAVGVGGEEGERGARMPGAGES